MHGNGTIRTPKDDLAPLFVRPQRAADLLGIGRTKVFQMMERGDLQSYLHGRTRLIAVADLHAIAERIRANPRIRDPKTLVSRARFERLRECVECVTALEAIEARSAVDDPAWYRWRDAIAALQSDDLVPLP